MLAAPAAQTNGGGGSTAAPIEVQQTAFKPGAWTAGAVAGGHGGEDFDEAKTTVARLERAVAEKVSAGKIRHGCVRTLWLGVACSGQARARWRGREESLNASSSAGFVIHKGEGDGRCS